MIEAESGVVRAKKKQGVVVWTLEPGEAREVAAFIVLVTTPGDLARKDAEALRAAADAIDGGEAQ